MNNSWKDFFTFSRRELGGIYVLLGILLILIILNPLIPKLIKKEKYDMEEFRREAEAFMRDLERRDSLNEIHPFSPVSTNKDHDRLNDFLADPFYFDPNEISEDGLEKTGMSKSVSGNILKYRKKGGKFRKPEDLKKIYGMDISWFKVVSPYIIIEVETQEKEDEKLKDQDFNEMKNEEKVTYTSEKENILVELNAADSANLVQCTGIGPAFAKRIIAYRELLGGYYDREQLMEVKGMDTARYILFREQVWVDPGLVRKMDVNKIEFKEMLRHPYFEYYLVKAIFNLKDRKKNLDSIGELKSLPEIYPELYQKISPYLEVRGVSLE